MNCLFDSMVYLLDLTSDEMAKELGHTGNEIVNDRRRGLHIVELTRLALKRRRYLVPIGGLRNTLQDDYGNRPITVTFTHEETIDILMAWDALIITLQNGHRHAVAWKDGKIHDPNGIYTSLGDFELVEIWLLC